MYSSLQIECRAFSTQSGRVAVIGIDAFDMAHIIFVQSVLNRSFSECAPLSLQIQIHVDVDVDVDWELGVGGDGRFEELYHI